MSIKVQNISKSYKTAKAVENISFEVNRGELFGLIGPDGAGKTTLINLLTGVLEPTEGRIMLEGQDITRLAPHQRVRRGMVRTFQINQLFATLTPLQSLALAVAGRLDRARRCWAPLGSDAQINAECEQLLAQFRLTDFADRATAELPYGKRRLLEIALAVAQKPSVLLLDEPAAGVPGPERADILATVAALPGDVSVVLIEHDMDLVFSFAKTLTVLVNGTVLTEGTPEQIAADPQVRAVYLGDSVPGRPGAGHG